MSNPAQLILDIHQMIKDTDDVFIAESLHRICELLLTLYQTHHPLGES